jgi:lysozyme family protein
MVGPSITDDERRVASRRLKAGFVGLVGASAGLAALAGDATPAQLLVAVVVGLLAGAALLRYLVYVGREWRKSFR